MIIKQKYIDMAWNRANMVEIFEEFHSGVLKKQGSRYKGRCVYHSDNNPSMYVDNTHNNVHCFGCGKHHTVFTFLMEELSCSFNDAVIWVLKKYCHDVDLDDIWKHQTEEDVMLQNVRESQGIAVDAAWRFFVECYHENTSEAEACRGYAEERWGKEFCEEYGIGYAPCGNRLLEWVRKKGYDIQYLLDTGMLSEEIVNDVRTGRYYDFFANRMMIPLKDRWGKVIAFSGRRMSDNQKQKYINNRCTERNHIYKKGEYAFGTEVALKAARQLNKLYLMEGAADVMTLFANGVLNACASCGGYWTKEQLLLFKKHTNSLCFVPDEDEGTVMVGESMMRKGEAFVVKSAMIAMELGFSVYVRELPSKEDEKVDVGSYVTCAEDWNVLSEEDFILWFARKRLSKNTSREEQNNVVNKVCDLLCHVENKFLRDTYLADLKTSFRFIPASTWKNVLAEAYARRWKEKDKEAMEDGCVDLSVYGFRQKDGHYYVTNNQGTNTDITNFTIKPLFYIENGENSVRIFEILGEKNSRPLTIEVPYNNVTRLDRFRDEIEKLGNYHFLSNQSQFEMFKSYLLDSAVEAKYVTVMGWNYDNSNEGFYAFANGVVYKGEWLPVDENGIVRIKGKGYYLPAFSEFNRSKARMFVNARRHEHHVEKELSVEEVFGLIEEVYGSKGIIGVMYCIATLFRDIVVRTTRSFPLLYLFGQKGTGKTEFAITLSRFFQRYEEINDLTNTSLYSIANKMESGCNTIVHLDEYRHTLQVEKFELMKGSYDSVGRTTKGDNTNERTQTCVQCGVIVTGSDVPDDDPALMTRMLFLEAYNNVRTQREREVFRKLKEMRDQGLTALTIGLLKYRCDFEKHFKAAWNEATARIKGIDVEGVMEERLLECWSVPYAVLLCFKMFGVNLPFTKHKVFKACSEGLQRQVEATHKTDEMADFWKLMMTAVNQHKLFEDSDFRIEQLSRKMTITKRRVHHDIDPSTNPETLIFVRSNSCFPVIKSIAMSTNRMKQGASTLDFYALNSEECLGTTCNPLKFDKLDINGKIIKMTICDQATGKVYSRKQVVQERAIIFNYDAVKKKYDIDLHTYEVNEPIEKKGGE